MVETQHNFLIFYTGFILSVVFLSGLAAVPILEQAGITPPTAANFNFITVLANFGSLLVVGVVPEFTIIFTIIMIPYLIGVGFIIWKALPFT